VKEAMDQGGDMPHLQLRSMLGPPRCAGQRCCGTGQLHVWVFNQAHARARCRVGSVQPMHPLARLAIPCLMWPPFLPALCAGLS